MLSRKLTRSIVAGAAAIAIAGGSYGIVSATSSSGSAASSSSTRWPAGSGGGGSNARSGPAAGGASGTVGNVSTSGFTITTSAGQKVTVNEASSTTYQNGTSPASASAITTGEPVLVLGTTSGTTIAATQVIVQPTGSGSAASSAAEVVPFQQRCTDHVKAGRSDPGELQPGVRDDRQRNGSEQGDGSRAGRLPGGRRRPCCAAEQRRVRGPLHRRQLAAPRLRQPELQGRRRRLAAAAAVGACLPRHRGDRLARPRRDHGERFPGMHAQGDLLPVGDRQPPRAGHPPIPANRPPRGVTRDQRDALMRAAHLRADLPQRQAPGLQPQGQLPLPAPERSTGCWQDLARAARHGIGSRETTMGLQLGCRARCAACGPPACPAPLDVRHRGFT